MTLHLLIDEADFWSVMTMDHPARRENPYDRPNLRTFEKKAAHRAIEVALGAPQSPFRVCALAAAGVDTRAAVVEAFSAITGATAIALKPALVMPKP